MNRIRFEFVCLGLIISLTAAGPILANASERCGVYGNQYISPSGAHITLDFAPHTKAGSPVEFIVAFNSAAAGSEAQTAVDNFLKVNSNLVPTLAFNADRMKRIFESGAVQWNGLEQAPEEEPTDPESILNRGQAFRDLQTQMVSKGVPPSKALLVLILIGGPQDYAHEQSSVAANNVRMVSFEDQTARKLYEQKSRELQNAGARLDSVAGGKFSTVEWSGFVQAIKDSMLSEDVRPLQLQVEVLKRTHPQDPKILSALDDYLSAFKEQNVASLYRDQKAAENILHQPGNGYLSMGLGHQNGMKAALTKFCQSAWSDSIVPASNSVGNASAAAAR